MMLNAHKQINTRLYIFLCKTKKKCTGTLEMHILKMHVLAIIIKIGK